MIDRLSVLDKTSKAVYIHFFDEQLLTSIGAYSLLSYPRVHDDLLLLLMATYEPLYMSTALVFENKFAQNTLDTLLPLFQRGQIQLAIKNSSLHDFILAKREQYVHVKHHYPFYWKDSWKKFRDLGLSYKNKQVDTTKALASSIIPDLQTQGIIESADRLGIVINISEINYILPYTIDSIINRNNKAITKSLFNKQYKAQKISSSVQRCFNIKISEHYIKTYLSEYDGTIATGLFSGVEYFSYLCPTFPAHHITLWHQIYSRIGVLPILKKLSAENIAFVRETVEFQNFIDEIRFFIAEIREKFYTIILDNPLLDINIISFLERSIRIHIRGVSNIPDNVDGFIKALVKVTASLKSFDVEDKFIDKCKFIDIIEKSSWALERALYKSQISDLKKIIMETPKYDLRQSNIGTFVGEAQSGSNQIGIVTAKNQDLATAALEIQELLEQLSKDNPISTDKEKMKLATQVADRIKGDLNLKKKVVSAIKSGATEALKEAIDNPIVNILFALIEGWQEI
jgi:hypothetical protein